MSAIECLELTKEYHTVLALQNLTLSIEYGKSFGLLGENGAGKSTLVRLIMGFIFPTSGQIRVLGQKHVTQAHAGIGYVREQPAFDPRVPGHKYLVHLGKLIGIRGTKGRQRIDEILARVNLLDAADRPVGTYSKGMQQRLAIAQALLTDPELLILDEPTSGLDPRSQWEIRQILLGLRQEDKTILLCSHYLAEVETLCDTIGIMRRGQMILSGSVSDLVQSKNGVELVLAEHLSARDVVNSLKIPVQSLIDIQGNTLRIQRAAQAMILEKLVQAHVPLISLCPLNQSLEEVYVQATNQADATLPSRLLSTSRGGTH